MASIYDYKKLKLLYSECGRLSMNDFWFCGDVLIEVVVVVVVNCWGTTPRRVKMAGDLGFAVQFNTEAL